MAWTENPIVVAGVVGGIIFLVYKFFAAPAPTAHPTHGNVQPNSNNNNNNALRPQQNPLNANQQPLVGAVAFGLGSTSPNSPSRNDDLSALLKLGKQRQWKIILHTRSNFNSIPVSILREATKSNPFLLVVHQLFTDSDEAKDVQTIKENVDLEFFPRDRLVLCTTDKGPEAIARQEEPVLFVSDNRALCNFLSAFLTFVVFVDNSAGSNGNDDDEENVASSVIKTEFVSPTNASKNGPNKIYIVKNIKAIFQ